MSLEVSLLGPGDGAVLERVAPGVFDHAVRPEWARAFLEDPRHHLVVAAEAGGPVVGFASAVTYLHPDKPVQMWINEVATAPDRRRRGVATAVVRRMLEHARSLGCASVWLGTEDDNDAARGLYRALGGFERSGMVVYEYAGGRQS